MPELSVFVTTLNNDRTLATCLGSVAWADEIVVLDSYSDDTTPAIAERFGACFYQHEFMGYGAQKQMALEKTSHDWVLLLDADEALSAGAAEAIKALMAEGPRADGYELPRVEQMFWRMCHPGTRMNYYLRLFRKASGGFDRMPIHAAPAVRGRVVRLDAPFYHFGEISVHAKVEKVNAYSSGLVDHKRQHGARANPWKMVIYPPWVWLRNYVFKRNFLNGWAGFTASVVTAFYAFMKYAKLYETAQPRRLHTDLERGVDRPLE